MEKRLLKKLIEKFNDNDFSETEKLINYITKESYNIDNSLRWKDAGVPLEKISKVYEAIFTAFYNKGALKKSLPLVCNILEEFPNFGQGWKFFSFILDELGLAKESLSAKQRAVELLPRDATARSILSYSLNNFAQYDKARHHAEIAVKLNPNFAEAYNNLGNALYYLKKYKEAENAYKQAIALKHDFAEAYNNLGNIYKEQINEKDAKIAEIEKILA